METNRPRGPIPVACVPGALTREGRVRSALLRERIASDIQATSSLVNGYVFSLSGDPEVLRSVAEWFTLERLCCPFLDFQLSWQAGSDRPELALTGPEGTKDFLHAEMPELPWRESPPA
jgi:hypothetical protein